MSTPNNKESHCTTLHAAITLKLYRAQGGYLWGRRHCTLERKHTMRFNEALIPNYRRGISGVFPPAKHTPTPTSAIIIAIEERTNGGGAGRTCRARSLLANVHARASRTYVYIRMSAGPPNDPPKEGGWHGSAVSIIILCFVIARLTGANHRY